MIAAPEAPRIPWLAAGTPDITPPQIPWLTDESACPEGWGWIEVAPGLNGCDPYPTGRVEDCGPTGAHFPGETGCRDLDSGDTEWPSDLPATNVLYVREGASGGNGTLELPYATLPEALAAAVEGTTIALGPGRYDTGRGMERTDVGAGVFETLSNVRANGVHIRGTSVARTTLFSTRPAPTTGDFAMLQVESSGVEISDLRFEGPHPAIDAFGGELVARRIVLDGTFGGLVAGAGATAVFEDVIARGWSGLPAVTSAGAASVTLNGAMFTGGASPSLLAQGIGAELSASSVAIVGSYGGVAVEGGAMGLERVALHDAVTGLGAFGVGSRLSIDGFSVDDVPTMEPALFARDGGASTLVDGVFRGTPGVRGMIAGLPGATVTVSRAVFTGNDGMVIEGESLTTDIVCRDVRACLYARTATAAWTLERIDVSGAGQLGLIADVNATLQATHVSIHDLSTPGSVALYALGGASMRVDGAALERMQFGAYAQGGAELSLSDVTIRDIRTSNEEAATGGVGANGSAVSVARATIERIEGPAVVAFDADGSVRLEDIDIRDFSGPPGRVGGVALFGGSAPSSVVRTQIHTGQGIGLLAGSEARLEDVLIESIRADADGASGSGLIVGASSGVFPPAQVTGSRVSVRETASVGLRVTATAEGSPLRVSAVLRDVRIERTGTGTDGGAGVEARGDADLSLTGFVIRDAATVGLSSVMGARMTLVDGLVSTSPTCTSSDSPLDLSTVRTDQCGPSATTMAP